MSRLVWDKTGERFYETGVDHGVLYPLAKTGEYEAGVAWNGLSSVSENPSGAEANDIYADNIKYLSLMSAEDFGLTIEAYTYPDEWAECDGSAAPVNGIIVGQQTRKGFGFSYRTKVGNDVDPDAGYKLHLIYNCKASPSDRAYNTINDSPEAISFSWTITTTPVETGVPDLKPSAQITLDSAKLKAAGFESQLTALEEILYGKDASGDDAAVDPRLPSISEVIGMFDSSDDDTPDDVETPGITLPETATVAVEATTTIEPSRVYPMGTTVTWDSSDDTIATVSDAGVVTGVAVGTATITGTIVVDGNTYTDTCTVTVTDGEG